MAGQVLQNREQRDRSGSDDDNELLSGLRQLARQYGAAQNECQRNKQTEGRHRGHLADSDIFISAI